MRKDKRNMTQEKAAAEAEERIRQEEDMREQRKNDSKEIAGETIRRELQESTSISRSLTDGTSDLVHEKK